MHWMKGLGFLRPSKKRPAGKSDSSGSGGKKSAIKRAVSVLKTAFCIAEPAVSEQRWTEKAQRKAHRAAEIAQIQAEKAKATRAADEARKEAARQARARKAEALRLKFQRRRMSAILHAWSNHMLQMRLDRLRMDTKLFEIHRAVQATRHSQMLREWLRLAQEAKPLPPGPHVPPKDLLVVCGSPLSPIAGLRIRSVDSSSDSRPDTPTRFFTAATHPADCRTCAACALGIDAPDAGGVGSGLWSGVGVC